MKKGSFHILLALQCVFSFTAYSQSASMSNVDSLIQQILGAKDDTNKVKLYIRLLHSYVDGNTERGLEYTQPAIALAQKLNWGVDLVKINSGRIYWKLGRWNEALTLHYQALHLQDEEKKPAKYANIMCDIGQDYADGGNYPRALQCFLKAKEVYLRINEPARVANVALLLSWVYQQRGNLIEASKCNLDALRIYDSLKENYGVAIASSNLANDYLDLDRAPEALPYLFKACGIFYKEKDFVNLSLNYGTLAKAYMNLKNPAASLKYIQCALFYGQIINDPIMIGNAISMKADIYYRQGKYAEAAGLYQSVITNYRQVNASHLLAQQYSNLGICYARLHKPAQAKAALDSAELFARYIDSRSLFSEFLNGKQILDSLKGNWKAAYLNHYNAITIHDSIYNAEHTRKLIQNQVQYEFDNKEAISKAEQEKKDIRQQTIRNSITAILAGALAFLVVVYRQRNKISKARKRSDELLLNILPEEVAEELKEKGAANAKQFDEVTVMFTDFKGFTLISENLSPTELVHEIHSCFKAFDDIITKNNLEKIKTIGDAYMCAGGLPVSNTTHADDVVKAALEIRTFMLQHFIQRKKEGKESFEIRIGIHTGSVVAGIVGVKKFAYDIWGDTVNIASRMESSGEAGKINISGVTYELVKDKFSCRYRGKIQAKNKGEIDMYFVEEKT